MASDMVVALAQSTMDGHALFGHNNNSPTGEGQALVRQPGRLFAPGEMVQASVLSLPQARRTFTVLGGPSSDDWGYRFGINEKGVVLGLTTIHTRLAPEGPALTGPDLVRLGLERSPCARQAVEVLSDLITRHGQGEPDPTERGTSGGGSGLGAALVILDGQEAYVLEACGAHWAVQTVGQVKAVSSNGLLRRDWDRISRGLADLAITRGWWPSDGCKLDFTGALGRQGPGHAAAVRRWGQATRQLEEHSGQLDGPFFRWLLREQAESMDQAGRALGNATTCAGSFLVRLSPDRDDLPLAWWSPGSPCRSIYLPIPLASELPEELTDADGTGSLVWRRLARWHADAQRDGPRLETQAALRAGLASLQERLDEDAHAFALEANALHRQGEQEQLAQRSAAFLRRNLERFEELGQYAGSGVLSPPHRPRTREEEYAALAEADF
jgi:secernin